MVPKHATPFNSKHKYIRNEYIISSKNISPILFYVSSLNFAYDKTKGLFAYLVLNS